MTEGNTMQTSSYRRRPETIEATRLTPENVRDVAEECGGAVLDDGSLVLPLGDGAETTIAVPMGAYVWTNDYGAAFESADEFEQSWIAIEDGPTVSQRLATVEAEIEALRTAAAAAATAATNAQSAANAAYSAATGH